MLHMLPVCLRSWSSQWKQGTCLHSHRKSDCRRFQFLGCLRFAGYGWRVESRKFRHSATSSVKDERQCQDGLSDFERFRVRGRPIVPFRALYLWTGFAYLLFHRSECCPFHSSSECTRILKYTILYVIERRGPGLWRWGLLPISPVLSGLFFGIEVRKYLCKCHKSFFNILKVGYRNEKRTFVPSKGKCIWRKWL